jgi:hypothetical protein
VDIQEPAVSQVLAGAVATLVFQALRVVVVSPGSQEPQAVVDIQELQAQPEHQDLVEPVVPAVSLEQAEPRELPGIVELVELLEPAVIAVSLEVPEPVVILVSRVQEVVVTPVLVVLRA